MNGQAQAVVDSYMKDLKRELRALPRDRRQEILDDIEGHIDESLGRNGIASEADARNLLDQLGEPSEIAAEARDRFGIPESSFGTREIWACILLAVGGVAGGIGWIVGVVLLWMSNAWNTKEKVIGTLALPLPLTLFLLIAVIGTADGGSVVCTGTKPGPVHCTGGGSSTFLATFTYLFPYAAVALIIGVPIWLAVKARRRTAPAGN